MSLFIRVSYEESFIEDFFELSNFPAKIGRDPKAECKVMGEDISRFHGQIAVENNELVYEDSSSLLGTYTDGKKIKRAVITEGLKLRIGHAALQFSLISFPVEKTHSYAEAAHSFGGFAIGKYLNLKGVGILAGILLAFLLATAENHHRRGDAFKNSITGILLGMLVAPLLFFVVIIIFRKLNRGEYSWQRSLAFSYFFVLYIELAFFIEKLFCWFDTFEILWSLIFTQFIYVAGLFFIWLNAVGKDIPQISRVRRSFIVAAMLLFVGYGVKMLSTGYQANYELESCYSLTGWHWGQGESLADWQSWVDEAAKELK